MVVVTFFSKKVPIREVTLKILHVWVGVPESAIKIFGTTKIGLREALPDHARLMQKPVVGHESIQLVGVSAKHRNVRVA